MKGVWYTAKQARERFYDNLRAGFSNSVSQTRYGRGLELVATIPEGAPLNSETPDGPSMIVRALNATAVIRNPYVDENSQLVRISAANRGEMNDAADALSEATGIKLEIR